MFITVYHLFFLAAVYKTETSGEECCLLSDVGFQLLFDRFCFMMRHYVFISHR